MEKRGRGLRQCGQCAQKKRSQFFSYNYFTKNILKREKYKEQYLSAHIALEEYGYIIGCLKFELRWT